MRPASCGLGCGIIQFSARGCDAPSSQPAAYPAAVVVVRLAEFGREVPLLGRDRAPEQRRDTERDKKQRPRRGPQQSECDIENDQPDISGLRLSRNGP
jgi:hypothetical protein